MNDDDDRSSPWARAQPGRKDRPRPAPASGRETARSRDTRETQDEQEQRKRERARAYIDRPGGGSRGAPRVPRPQPVAEAAPQAPREQRLYGLNACLAAFAHRPDALRKVYLSEARIPVLKPVLAWCVQHRIGYRVVEEGDLDKLTASRHHEGVCFDVRRPEPIALDAFLAGLPAAPARSLLLWLDGVGNPHNLGALLRSSAHFGVHGVFTPRAAALDVSGAAARVAEGAAEVVPLVQADDPASALASLRKHGYALAATVPRAGESLYAAVLPARLVLVFGAEGEGMRDGMIDAADLRLTIPGSGAIESLNVAASVAVLLGEYWRQHASA